MIPPVPSAERACDCCPHTTWDDMERDALVAEAWEYCPTRGCVWQLCVACLAEGRRPRRKRRPVDRQRSLDL